MKKVLISLIMILTANIVLAQQDSILDMLNLQKNLLTLIDQRNSLLQEEKFSLEVRANDLERLDWLITSIVKSSDSLINSQTDSAAKANAAAGELIIMQKFYQDVKAKFDQIDAIHKKADSVYQQTQNLYGTYVTQSENGFKFSGLVEKRSFKALIKMMILNDEKINKKIDENAFLVQTITNILAKQTQKLEGIDQIKSDFCNGLPKRKKSVAPVLGEKPN